MFGLAKAAIGMEINQREVVAVQLRQGRRGPTLGGHAREPLSQGAVGVAHVAQPAELVRAVKAALQKAKAGQTNICLSLSCDAMDAREFRYPAMPERELLSNIQWDLQQLFSLGEDGGDERLVDIHLLAHRNKPTELDATERDSRQTYLAVSAPKKAIYAYLNPLHAERLFPEIVDVGAFSLPWAVPRGGGVGYLHLGPELTHFVFMDNGAFELQRLARLSLTPLLQGAGDPTAGLRMLQEALAALQTGGDAPVGKVLEALLRWLEDTFEFVRVQRGSFTVEERMQTLVLSGAGATVPGLAAMLGEHTGLQVAPAIPSLLTDGSEALAADEAPAYALAVALAQRGLSEL